MVWYSQVFKNFPVCCDAHSQKLCIVNETEVDVFLEFSMIKYMLEFLSLFPLPFLNPAQTSESFQFMYF